MSSLNFFASMWLSKKKFPEDKIAYCNGTSTIVCKYIFQSYLTHQTKFNFIWNFSKMGLNEINHWKYYFELKHRC